MVLGIGNGSDSGRIELEDDSDLQVYDENVNLGDKNKDYQVEIPDISPQPADQVLEPMHADKECCKKLEMEMQQVTSELTSTKAQVQKLELQLKLSESLRVQSENRASLERETVKSLEEKLKILKADLEQNRDRIQRDTIDKFKSSDEYWEGCHRNFQIIT